MSGKTIAVNKRRDVYDIYIGLGSIWGNPFVIGRDGNRDEVIEKYETYYLANPELQQQINTLKGKRLGCYCKPAACHGDILARFADLT